MTKMQFEALHATSAPTGHPAVRAWWVDDYHDAINLLASINPDCRRLAAEIHGRLRPGNSRIKHVAANAHGHGLLFCGAFFRDHKANQGQRHTSTLVLSISDPDNPGAEQYALA